ncbi:heparinase II/III family protein [Maridesulfovibrio hydrothermalis]|uniref:Heparinase II/III family protein n=1 Tax=Maridesulfovibrio hydrothermalis AM13 = DSM 14728 TaxID=1121451 RepID=L0RDK9_9BACT|nr:alginate lyase family protein [Maridesulfovibrio hydrothermalis]CCO24834.1 Heparinase II/III family protein [Maridesulfovibrio hydrothermalis AM13 = DSM 14728]
MKADKIIWVANRLKAMGPQEILWRCRNEAVCFAQSKGFLLAENVAPADLMQQTSSWIKDGNLNSFSDEIINTAESILLEGLSVFALPEKVQCVLPQWNRDPLTGVLCPLNFGKKFNYKDRSLCGDIKYLWEVGRFLQIVPPALAWKISGDHKYLDAIRQMLESWLDQCPYMLGVHWSSSLELGIRLINWSLAWQFIGGVDSPLFQGEGGAEFRNRWLKSIYQHIHFIDGGYSKGSSANNHLIGEAAGVFIACRTWPYWAECAGYADRALTVLENEVGRQVGFDGVDLEQAMSYQQFVLDFLLFSYISCPDKFSSRYQDTLVHMAEFIAAMTDAAGNVPMIGDADDGLVSGFGLFSGHNPFSSLTASVGLLFSRPELLEKSAVSDLKSCCMAGKTASAADLSSDVSLSRAFVCGGYYILGDHFNSESELHIILDGGALGYGSLCAHGHADALSMYLSYCGKEFLIDPGTYIYNGNQKWREYFRGTSAHNTVRVDGVNQSESGGDFLWKTHAQAHAECEFQDDVETFRGSHDGYMRLSDPVIHERLVALDKVGKRIAVQDHLQCGAEHMVEQFWHFSEECVVEQVGPDKIKVCNSGTSIEIHFGQNISLEIVSANSEIPLGWISRSFDCKIPCTTVIARADIKGSSFLTASILY